VTATRLDGRAVARQIEAEVTESVSKLKSASGVAPCLAAVLVGENSASQLYVNSKRKACDRVGIASQLHRLPRETTTEKLLSLVDELNSDADVHGILIQLPLPEQIDQERVLWSVSPLKDVDAFHPENAGLLSQGRPRFLPCTPHGVVQLLLRENIETAGRRVVIVGRSDIVGKPLALLLVGRGTGGDATVTLCHSRTRDLDRVTREAEILIAATGQAHLITADMVRPGAVVIDVGQNRLNGKLVGDVDFDAVSRVASRITPVPGGIGPLTVAMLLNNTVVAARLQHA